MLPSVCEAHSLHFPKYLSLLPLVLAVASPEVSLIQSNSPSSVLFLAKGFCPTKLIISWKRDGKEMKERVNVSDALPTLDGTFQKAARFTVSPEERTKSQYTCEVTHQGGDPVVMTLTVRNLMPCQDSTSISSVTERELLVQ